MAWSKHADLQRGLLEPAAEHFSEANAGRGAGEISIQLSIAISLKRIADAVAPSPPGAYSMLQRIEDALSTIANRMPR